MSSPVRQLQWESGLQYIFVATASSVGVQLNLVITGFSEIVTLQCIGTPNLSGGVC